MMKYTNTGEFGGGAAVPSPFTRTHNYSYYLSPQTRYVAQRDRQASTSEQTHVWEWMETSRGTAVPGMVSLYATLTWCAICLVYTHVYTIYGICTRLPLYGLSLLLFLTHTHTHTHTRAPHFTLQKAYHGSWSSTKSKSGIRWLQIKTTHVVLAMASAWNSSLSTHIVFVPVSLCCSINMRIIVSLLHICTCVLIKVY